MKQKVKVTLCIEPGFLHAAKRRKIIISELLERNIIRELGLRKLYLLPENDPGNVPTLA